MTSVPAGRPHPDLPPLHPGAVLRDDVLPALGISVSAAARELGISRQTLHGIMAGQAAVSVETALRLGQWLGNGPELWVNLQRSYDLWHARRDMAEIVKAIPRRGGGRGRAAA